RYETRSGLSHIVVESRTPPGELASGADVADAAGGDRHAVRTEPAADSDYRGGEGIPLEIGIGSASTAVRNREISRAEHLLGLRRLRPGEYAGDGAHSEQNVFFHVSSPDAKGLFCHRDTWEATAGPLLRLANSLVGGVECQRELKQSCRMSVRIPIGVSILP